MKELTMQEGMHLIIDKLFMSREKWGDEVFFEYMGHIHGGRIHIHHGKWKANGLSTPITIKVNKGHGLNEVLNDLDKYHEQGFKYFIENDEYYWYKSENFIERFRK